jgi:diaminopimelate decarboxylase
MAEGFSRYEGELYAEAVPLRHIAAEVGTPVYVYSAETMRERVRRLQAALAGIPHRLHFAAKANSCGGVLRTLRDAGVGVDVVSGGELFKAIRAGFRPGTDVIFGGVGKTLREIGEAIGVGVKLLNVESEAELHLASEWAVELGTSVAIGIRVNPEVQVETAHEYIATGDKGHKFGVPLDDALRVARVAMQLPGLSVQGVGMHVGSQLYSVGAYRDGAAKLVALAQTLRAEGAPIRYLDLGGGLPVPYAPAEAEPDLAAYGAAMREAVAALGDVELVLEHGRYLVAAAGILVTEVLYRKHNGGVEFVVCDAGMTELIRPSHYEAYHHVEPVAFVEGQVTADVVGPVCESGDFLAVARTLPDVQPGALLAIHTVGAYGSAMASRYNARPLAAEVVVDGNRWAVVTQPEDYPDLVRQDVESPHWQEP